MKKIIFEGCGTAIVTPFTKTGVNFEEFGKLIEDQIKNNIDSIIVCGTTGEASTMTNEEKKDLEIMLTPKCFGQKSSELSGGMKRRLQIARALFSPTSMLIMDEPFRGLDEENRKRCIGMIKKYQKNRILLITSHDVRDVEELGGIKWVLGSH